MGVLLKELLLLLIDEESVYALAAEGNSPANFIFLPTLGRQCVHQSFRVHVEALVHNLHHLFVLLLAHDEDPPSLLLVDKKMRISWHLPLYEDLACVIYWLNLYLRVRFRVLEVERLYAA